MYTKINYNYLRPQKARYLKEMHNKSFLKKTNPEALSYSKATILPLKEFADDSLAWGRGGVVDNNGNYISSSSIEHLINFSYDFENYNIKDEKVVYCGYLINHWGHFLVDAVSRLWYFLKNDNDVDKYVFVVKSNEQNEIKGNYKEFFELLGILDKIEIINQPTQYREVIIPELSYDRSKLIYYEEYKMIFNKVSENIKISDDWETADRIFFTRSQLNKALSMESGLELLDNYFSNNGFKIISPEKISLSYLIFLIKNSKICASISGTLPHNMLFGNDGQKICIIERNAINNEIQVDVNMMKELDVTYIDGNYSIYPVELSYGPFIFGYTKSLQKYTNDMGFIPPSAYYLSEKYNKLCLKKYFREYEKEHHYKWFMDDWMIKYTDCIYEAYKESEDFYKKYLLGIKPFKFSQYFHICQLKQMVRSIIKK